MSSTATARTRAGSDPSTEDARLDPALVLLQRHQIGLITPAMLGAARRRLGHALDPAGTARPADPALLLEQLLTDLGITVDLP